MADSIYHRGLGFQHEAVRIFMPAGADAPVTMSGGRSV
jgi:hypothetical protein